MYNNNDNGDNNLQSIRIICARPGSRIWECSIDGNVLQTHKFKTALSLKQSTKIRGQNGDQYKTNQENGKHVNIDQLIQLQPINRFFVLGYTTNIFYVFDLIHSNVIVWNDSFEAIHTIKIVGEDTIILFTKDYKTFTFRLMQLDRVFYESINKELFVDGGQILLQNLDYFKEKIADITFRYYYSILQNKSLNENLLNELNLNFDTLFKQKYGDNYRNEDVNGMILRMSNGIYVIENSFTSQVEHAELKYESKNLDISDDQTLSNDDEIVVPKKVSTSNRKFVERKKLTEDDKIVQNLFFIYKSLKISNFNLIDRYAELFDHYDLSGIIQLLNALEKMILENDHDVTETEAKQHCARMYLNYIKINSMNALDNVAKDFLIECFLLCNKSSSGSIQRCKKCHFPLIVEITVLKHHEIAGKIVDHFLEQNERDRLWELIEQVPPLLNFALKAIIKEKIDKQSKLVGKDYDTIGNMLFSCANQLQFEQFVQKYSLLRTYEFWNGFLVKLDRLLVEQHIQCTRCDTINQINLQELGESKTFYTYDYALNVCADYLNGLTALKICRNASIHIPNDAISKTFYLKCLLNP